MEIVIHILILLLAFLSFLGGKTISDSYNRAQIQELEYQLRLMAAQKGIGFVAPPQKNRRMPIGQPFMDKLHETGRATTKIEK